VLRGLDGRINAIIAKGVEGRGVYVAVDAQSTEYLVTTVPGAASDTGRHVAVIEIEGVDRRAWGSNHLTEHRPGRPDPQYRGGEHGQALAASASGSAERTDIADVEVLDDHAGAMVAIPR